MEFAVLTGCLRVSKESIFIGLNNFKILSITDSRFDEQFGFTDQEVRELLAFYQVENRFDETKEWYDGYHFGNADIYCPWDVINHVDRIKDDPKARPEAYWINTSGNDLVKRFVDKASKTTRNEIERLIAGECFADIIVETDDPDAGIIAELKYTKEFNEMERECQKALKQIKDRRYQEYLLNDGRHDILLYGIAFCKKRCKVMVERE